LATPPARAQGSGVENLVSAWSRGEASYGTGSAIAGSVWLTHGAPPHGSVTQAKERDDVADGGGI